VPQLFFATESEIPHPRFKMIDFFFEELYVVVADYIRGIVDLLVLATEGLVDRSRRTQLVPQVEFVVFSES
jgi:hypothetical protein